MAPKKMPWFRFYAETVSDRKIRRLKVEHRWLWVVVLCAARQSPEPGRLLLADDQPIDHVDLADLGAMSERAVKDGLKALHAGGLIDDDNGTWSVPKWEDRQFLSDNSTARATASKNRSKRAGSNNVATLQQRPMQQPCIAPETETETDVTPPTPSCATHPVDNQSASHGHYPWTDTPAVHPAVAQLHATLANYPGAPS